MRRFFLVLFILPVVTMCRKSQEPFVPVTVPVVTKAYTLIADTIRVNEAFNGFYIALPEAYNYTTAEYPLLIFLHGLGQRGNGQEELKYLLFDGIGKVLKDDRMPATFTVNGNKFSMIVVTPQYNQQPREEDVMQLLEYVQNRYRIRKNRIYLSGLSLGARIATLVAAKYPKTFAAMVPIAGVATNEGMSERCRIIAEANLPVWEFHNEDDPMADVADARRFIEYLSGYTPPILPRFTVFEKYGHDAWTTALDTAYREDGKNVYEWMLQYFR